MCLNVWPHIVFHTSTGMPTSIGWGIAYTHNIPAAVASNARADTPVSRKATTARQIEILQKGGRTKVQGGKNFALSDCPTIS